MKYQDPGFLTPEVHFPLMLQLCLLCPSQTGLPQYPTNIACSKARDSIFRLEWEEEHRLNDFFKVCSKTMILWLFVPCVFSVPMT